MTGRTISGLNYGIAASLVTAEMFVAAQAPQTLRSRAFCPEFRYAFMLDAVGLAAR